jgi:hypothetical protein
LLRPVNCAAPRIRLPKESFFVRAFLAGHPYLAPFIVLALAMQVVLYSVTRDVALAPSQYAFIALATVALAGLCVWIMTWEK